MRLTVTDRLLLPLTLDARCIGFVWQGFGSGGGYRGGFCKKLLEASPGLEREPIPAGSEMDPPPAKAEPISDSGNASGITFLRRKKSWDRGKRQLERGVRTCKRNNPADTKVSEEGGGGDAPGAGAEIPLQPVVKTMVRQAVPLQPREVHGEEIPTCSPREGSTQERFMKDCIPWEGPHSGAGKECEEE